MKIVLEHLTKQFQSRSNKKETVTAVNDLDISLPDGELIGLLGPSGCGKSTVLNLISGLEKPTQGRIYFGDDDVTGIPPEKRGVGLVFQNYALYPHLTAVQNIMFPLQNLKGADKLSKQEIYDRAADAAKLVQIERLLNRKPNELSGGQQQRVAIARALVKTPRVLLLDEPLSNLDARLRLQTREEIRRIQRETGVTTVFVTHDQEEAMSICDTMIVMEAGRLRQYGKPQDIYDDPTGLFVARFLGTPAINVFDGRVEDGRLFIGGAAVLGTPSVKNGKVTVGIRPEGFIPDPNGGFAAELIRLEVMGRDTSALLSHPDCTSPSLRAIISSEESANILSNGARFSLKENKVFLFDADTGKRIRF